MKKPIIYFATLLLITISFYSCGNDDDGIPSTPETGEGEGAESVNLETIISEIINISTGDFKIASATLSNTNVSDLDITQVYNVQDDRFGLSASSTNGININWLEAYEIETNAIDLETVRSDNYKRSSQTIVTSSSTASPYVFTNTTGNIILTYNQVNETLTGEVSNPDGTKTMTITLTPVTASDFQEVKTPQNFNLIFSTNTSQPVTGLNYSYAAKSLYAMAHNFQTLSIYKYAEESQVTSSISAMDDAIGSDQFEFIDGRIKWVSPFSSLYIDYNLLQVITGSAIDLTPDSRYTTTTENNTVFAIGGYGGHFAYQISTLSPSATSFLEFGNMSSERSLADATVVDSDLYVFGGSYIAPDGTFSFYDSILKHDIATGNLIETIPLGVELIDSYVSRKGELIYVAGNVLVTNSNNGGIGETRRYFGVYNTITGVLQEIDIESQLPTDRSIRGFAISENAMYFAFDEINTTTGFWRMDVYQASL